MNKKYLIQTIFSITLLTATLAFAGWNTNTSTPTGGNMGIPINTSSSAQIKDGGLSVGKFVGMGNAQFNQQVFMNGSLLSSSTTLAIGDTTNTTNVNVPNGQTRVGYTSGTSGTITGKTLKPTASNYPVCADINGNLITCPKMNVSSITTWTNNGQQYTLTVTLDTPAKEDVTALIKGLNMLDSSSNTYTGTWNVSFAKGATTATATITNDDADSFRSNGIPTLCVSLPDSSIRIGAINNLICP